MIKTLKSEKYNKFGLKNVRTGNSITKLKRM